MNEKLTSLYPTSEDLKSHLKIFDDESKNGFIRLWLSEGIPYAFKDDPLKYEKIRSYIAKKLNIIEKEITIIGSARIGMSLDPKKYGGCFNPKSDFDFSIISGCLFDQCKSAFEIFKIDYDQKKIIPIEPEEKKYWPANCDCVPKNLSNGFIDPHKIPSRKKYNPAKAIKSLCEELEKRFLNYQKASFRVYKDWGSFTKQVTLNLNALIKKI